MKGPTDLLVIGQLERSAGEMQAGLRVLLGQSAGSCTFAKRTAGGGGASRDPKVSEKAAGKFAEQRCRTLVNKKHPKYLFKLYFCAAFREQLVLGKSSKLVFCKTMEFLLLRWLGCCC